MCVAAFQNSPGYMDADYYFAGGVQIVEGKGLSEPYIWNFLGNPDGIPHPSHAYWMPLASFVSALSMYLAGEISFFTARIGFQIIAALIPPLTAGLAYQISANAMFAAISGVIVVFSGFYLPYTSTTDTFGICMVLGALLFLLISSDDTSQETSRQQYPHKLRLISMGLVAGLMHLARTDGSTWLLLTLISVCVREASVSLGGEENWVNWHRKLTSIINRRVIIKLSFVLIGYLLIMSPWMIRNISVFGTPLSPGGSRALWLTDYDELFNYPIDGLTFSRWWDAGLGEILKARLWAIGINLQRSLAEQGGIFMVPLILLGMWRLRRNPTVRFGALAWLFTFVMMSFIFPYAGARGGFFHSSAAIQPLFWVMVPIGLDVFINWGVRVRGWNYKQAFRIFGGAVIGFAALLSVYIFVERVTGQDIKNPTWDISNNTYRYLEEKLTGLGAKPSDRVLVNNPPGYYIASGREAVVIPNGDFHTLLEAANRYMVDYMLLDENHPVGLEKIFADPYNVTDIIYLSTEKKTHIFKLK
jgi:hypothetical protein